MAWLFLGAVLGVIGTLVIVAAIGALQLRASRGSKKLALSPRALLAPQPPAPPSS